MSRNGRREEVSLVTVKMEAGGRRETGRVGGMDWTAWAMGREEQHRIRLNRGDAAERKGTRDGSTEDTKSRRMRGKRRQLSLFNPLTPKAPFKNAL